MNWKLYITGLYIPWDSFCSKQLKINFIKTLVHQALVICSETKLDSEIAFIRKILSENGYPLNILESSISEKMQQFYKLRLISQSPSFCSYHRLVRWMHDLPSKFQLVSEVIFSPIHVLCLVTNLCWNRSGSMFCLPIILVW